MPVLLRTRSGLSPYTQCRPWTYCRPSIGFRSQKDFPSSMISTSKLFTVECLCPTFSIIRWNSKQIALKSPTRASVETGSRMYRPLSEVILAFCSNSPIAYAKPRIAEIANTRRGYPDHRCTKNVERVLQPDIIQHALTSVSEERAFSQSFRDLNQFFIRRLSGELPPLSIVVGPLSSPHCVWS